MTIVDNVRTIPGDAYGTGWIDATGEDLSPLMLAPKLREVAYVVESWVKEIRATNGSSSLFDRRGFTVGDNPYDQMRVAKKAVREDDVVGGVADVTEGLIFQQVKWESANPDAADVFNQWAADVNLDDLLRQCYRDLFTYSQFFMACTWGRKTYTPRNRTFDDPNAKPDPQQPQATDPITGLPVPAVPRRGRARRKKFEITVPVAMSLLDPNKIVPVGHTIFGQKRYAWIATKAEAAVWDSMTNGEAYDPTLGNLIIGRYMPSESEKITLAQWGIDHTNLLLLNPQTVWRHTATKPGYEDFPDVRITSVFKLLDLKQQLLSADRVSLVGAANYILLVKKGDKDSRATPNELDNLRENFQVLAKLPVIVSDHRLEIEIITPKVDFTLNAEKYDTLDRRILSRLLGSLTASSSGQRNESTLTVAKMVARLLESKRWMLRRSWERNVAKMIVERNPEDFPEAPNLAFTPARVELETQSEVLQAAQALNAKGDISRESMLELVGMDQSVELQRKLEAKLSGADFIFDTHVPFDSPLNQPGNVAGSDAARQQGPNGAQGGRPAGGGKPPQNAGGTS